MFKYARIGPSSARHRARPSRRRRSLHDLRFRLRDAQGHLVGRSSALLLIGFAILDGFDLGIGHAVALRRPHRRRAARGAQFRRPDLGRQPGLVHHRGRRDVRGVAARLCDGILGLLHRADPGAVRALPASGRVSTTGARSPIRAGATRGTGASSSAGFVPALVFGVAFGNLLARRSVPLRRRPARRSTRDRSSAC